jgi:hypothetical protein
MGVEDAVAAAVQSQGEWKRWHRRRALVVCALIVLVMAIGIPVVRYTTAHLGTVTATQIGSGGICGGIWSTSANGGWEGWGPDTGIGHHLVGHLHIGNHVQWNGTMVTGATFSGGGAKFAMYPRNKMVACTGH